MNAHFEPVPTDAPLPVVVVGAGGMGAAWIAAVEESHLVDLRGIVDLNQDAARAAAVAVGRPDLPTGTATVPLARETGAQAVIDATIPEAHHPVTTEALFAGLPVLGEKPVAATLPQSLALAATSTLTNQLFMVSQSRRYNQHVVDALAMSRQLGTLGICSVDFFKAPRFGGFRDAMPHPLLVDMAIHQFDLARLLLDAEPVSVSCEEYNPNWSWYDGDAGALAIFEMTGGARFIFNGSWCSPGLETSWNGRWRISGAEGSVLWDGDNPPISEPNQPIAANATPVSEGIRGALVEFVTALRDGTRPIGEVHSNLLSFAMVEAAVRSTSTGQRVHIRDLLDESLATALDLPFHPAVLDTLRTGNVLESLLPA
ncbi:Gfo/Idh/MocA family oxidoreductase [Arthrobacter tecti]